MRLLYGRVQHCSGRVHGSEHWHLLNTVKTRVPGSDTEIAREVVFYSEMKSKREKSTDPQCPGSTSEVPIQTKIRFQFGTRNLREGTRKFRIPINGNPTPKP